jgi:serine/threonine protein kinase
VTRYELLDRIGVGGMAEIFRGKAVAAGGFEKPVAIKRILPHLSQDTRFVELLIAEAKVLSLLKHRNIVQIFDVGLGDDGQYFLVMEYVDGKDLGAVQRGLETKRRRLPFDLCLHIGAEICEALEHAHTSRGPDGKPMSLVHRDVSPSNVLLSRAGEIKLTDFGIAKRAESEATQGGAVRGKFGYISPEQARNEPLDPRSDVFSVGILLWELICNRRLFSGLDDLAALRAVRDPVVKRPTELDPRLPAEIDQLLLTALAKDKKNRFSGCGQLGQKLRTLRYSLETTSGDPATELAKIIDSTELAERESHSHITPARPSGSFEAEIGGEATVIRIQTADAFSAREDVSVVHARRIIDRFEEEETRQAQLTGDQIRMLRGMHTSTSGDEDMTGSRGALGGHHDHDPQLDAATVAYSEGYDPSLATPPHHTAAPSPRPLPGVKPVSRARPAPDPAFEEHTIHGTPAPVPIRSTQLPSAGPPSQLPAPRTPPPLGNAPYVPQPPAASFPSWGKPADAKPPLYPRPSMPGPRPQGLQPWVLIVGAVVMAALAFAITRAFIG